MYSSLCTEEIQNFFSGSLLHLTLAFFCHTNPLHVLFHYIHVIFFYSFNQNMKSVFTLINFFQNFCYTNTNVFYHRDVKEYTVCTFMNREKFMFSDTETFEKIPLSWIIIWSSSLSCLMQSGLLQAVFFLLLFSQFFKKWNSQQH